MDYYLLMKITLYCCMQQYGWISKLLLRERRQTQKIISCLIPFMWNSRKGKAIAINGRSIVACCRGWAKEIGCKKAQRNLQVWWKCFMSQLCCDYMSVSGVILFHHIPHKVLFITSLTFSLANNLKQHPSKTFPKISRYINYKEIIRPKFDVLLRNRRYA